MQRWRLVLFFMLVVGGMTLNARGDTIRTTEILLEGRDGPNGYTPSYLEVTAPLQSDPFDIVVIDIAAGMGGRVVSVVEITPSLLHQVYVVHEEGWSGHEPAAARFEVEELGLLNFAGVGARAVLTYDGTTDFTVNTAAGVVEETGGWVDSLAYASGGVLVDEAWADEAVDVPADGAIYRALEPGGGMIAATVDDQLAFTTGYALDPARANPSSLDIEPAHLPEPGTAALAAVALTLLAAGRRTGRDRAGRSHRSAHPHQATAQ